MRFVDTNVLLRVRCRVADPRERDKAEERPLTHDQAVGYAGVVVENPLREPLTNPAS